MAVAPAKAGGSLPRWAGYLTKPVLLGLACLALYLWVSGLELDSIEARELNAETITQRFIEHLELTAAATVAVVVLAVSAGVLLTRPFARRISPYLVNVANIGQGLPSIGVLALLAIFFGLGFQYALIGLIAYAFLPVLRNTMVGLRQVDRNVIEAGRGMGMSKNAVLFRIELPLAVPIMLAGIRTALVITIGTATLATFIGAGGLGALIETGISLNRTPVLVTGAVLTSVLALFVDWLAGVAEDILRPKGL
ncbi:MAG TPA: ABC transporter permease [Rubrobacteraceae bacterium]|jgi:osmoprotectant transport system permease protein|nr:ABC transporter permease [Rubrobacteraceae bacterium]